MEENGKHVRTAFARACEVMIQSRRRCLGGGRARAHKLVEWGALVISSTIFMKLTLLLLSTHTEQANFGILGVGMSTHTRMHTYAQ